MNNQSNSPIENEEFVKFVGLNPNQIQFIENMDVDCLIGYIYQFNEEVKNSNIQSNYIDIINIDSIKTSENFDKGEKHYVGFNFTIIKNGIYNKFEFNVNSDEYGLFKSFQNTDKFQGIYKELDEWANNLEKIKNGILFGEVKFGYENKVDEGVRQAINSLIDEYFKNVYCPGRWC